MTTNPHVHAVFGEMFDRLFPVIAAPLPPSDPLPELSKQQLAEGEVTEERR